MPNTRIGGIKRLAGFISIAFSIICFMAAFILLVNAKSGPALAATGINQQISFTGKIVKSDGTNIADGTYNMEFKIYQDGNNQGTGSTLKWTEDWLVGHAGGITLTNGTFQVNLGAGSDSSALDSAVNWNQSVLWLSMQIGNSSSCTITTSFQSNCGGDTEMKPYIALTAVPQAFNAESLGGLSYANYTQLSPGSPQSGSLNVSGGLTIGSGQNVTVGSTAGSSISACTGSQVVTGFQSVGGIVVAGTCTAQAGGGSLSSAYNSSGTSGNTITLSNTGLGVIVQDASSSTITNLFAVQNSGGTSTYLAVTAANSGSIVVGSAANKLTLASGSITTGSGTLTIDTGSASALSLGSAQASSITIGHSSSPPTITLTGSNFSVNSSGSLTLASGQNIGIGGNFGVGTTGCTGNFVPTNFSTVGGIFLSLTCNTISNSNLANSSITINTSGNIVGGTVALGSSLTVATVNSPTFSSIDSLSSGSSLGLGTSSAGAITLGNASNSTFAFNTKGSANAFQINNQNGTALATLNTNGGNANNLIANPSIESAISNWSALNSAPTVARVTSPAYEGNASLQVATGTNASGGGVSYTTGTTWLSTATTYTLSAYVYTDSISNFTTFDMGWDDTAQHSCFNGRTAPVITYHEWTRVTCTFVTSTTTPTNSFVYFKTTASTNLNFYVDDVTLQTDANADANYRNATFNLTGTVLNGPLILQGSSDSSTALQVENSAGVQILNVDTTDLNFVHNPGFEINASGWTAINGATNNGTAVVERDTTRSYSGIASGMVTTTSTSNSGMRYTFASQLPSNNYVISFEAWTNAADTTLNAGFNNGTTDTACTGISPSPSSSNTGVNGWTRFTCTVSSSAVSSIYITSGTTAVTLWVDAVEVDAGTSAQPFGTGNLNLNAVVTTPAIFADKSNATTAFQIQDSGSNSYFTANTLNKVVYIGSTTADATQILLQLDSFSTFADTATCSSTSNQGGLYYNTNTNAIRACLNGGWEDLVSTAGLGIMLFGVVPDSGSNPGDLISTANASVSGPCKVSWSGTFTVSVAPCIAYSGGRKVVVANATTVTLDHSVSGEWEHLCFNSSGALSTTLSAATSTETNTTNDPNASYLSTHQGAPYLCLADILMNSTTGVAQIYDVRTFTTSVKEFATAAAALGLGWPACGSAKQVTTCGASTGTGGLEGIVIATDMSTSSGAPNVILSVEGPTMAKPTLTSNVAGDIAEYGGGTTANRVLSTVAVSGTLPTAAYSTLGISRSASPSTACTSTASAVDCDYQMYFFQNRR